MNHLPHAENVASKLVLASVLVGDYGVERFGSHPVALDDRVELPAADAAASSVTPHPALVNVAGCRPHADAAEVRVVADVDREPAPHLEAAALAFRLSRSPGLVAIAASTVQSEGRAVDLRRARPRSRLLEMAAGDGAHDDRLRTVELAPLTVDA